MARETKINDRKREQRKLRALALETGMNRAARRAAKRAHTTPVETPVTDELKAKAKARKTKITKVTPIKESV
jgi:hypothetical protein